MKTSSYKDIFFKDILAELFYHKSNKKEVFCKSIELLTWFENYNGLSTTLKINFMQRINLKNWQCYCGWYKFNKEYMEIYYMACDDLIPNREIMIKNKYISRSVLGTLLHEYGHFLNEYFELKFFSTKIKNNQSRLIDELYMDVYNSSRKYKVVNYLLAPADPMEDFAETFIYFVLNPNWLKKHYKLKYEFFTDVLELKPIHDLSHAQVYKITYQYNQIG